MWGQSGFLLTHTNDRLDRLTIASLILLFLSGVLWLVISLIFFAAGLLVGIAAFKNDFHTQNELSEGFLGGTPF